MADIHLAGARAIDAAALDALNRHRGPTHEPYLVAAIFRSQDFLDTIKVACDRRWPLLRVATVFVHQKPYVTFSCGGQPAHCELGDALVVYREWLRAGQSRVQAAVFQAKKWNGPTRHVVRGDSAQQALYRHWPPFRISGSGIHRDVTLPPGDYGRALGLVASGDPTDVPRASPLRPTEPSCYLDADPRIQTMGTLGRAIRDIVRFELGERVQGQWATVVMDILTRVGPSPIGPTYQVEGPRGIGTQRRPGDRPEPKDESPPEEAVDAWLNRLNFNSPPSDATVFGGDDGGPLSILILDSGLPD